MRWAALDVDYEMSGKDLIDSVRIGAQICRVLGGTPPESLTYELFLDENGEKISKSRGNGLTIDEWLRYGTPESLQLFLYREPEEGQAPPLRRDPAQRRRVRRLRRGAPGPGRRRSASATRPGTSTTGSCRTTACRPGSRSRCC
jgi:hypothetical protein